MAFKNFESFKQHPAYQYAQGVANGDIIANKDVTTVCQRFLADLEAEKVTPFFFDYKFANKITTITSFIKMPNGVASGKTARDSLAGFQWFFIMNALCWKMKDNPDKRRYEKSVLLIGRKNGKTFLVGMLFIILLLVEPQFSRFYSVAPDLDLSSLIKDEMDKQISVSPILAKHFNIKKKVIECKPTDSSFQPLATSKNRMDGRLANVFVCDEVGALVDRQPIDSMESSQMNVINRTGILISTAYETLNNPMTQEVDYATKVIHGEVDDPTEFALLYRPDEPEKWATSDEELLKSNPLAQTIESTFDFLKKQRELAITIPEKRNNFLTKHMNIFVNGEQVESFVSKADLEKCEIPEDSFDWYGKDVYVGFDLSQTDDNTGVTMSNYDRDTGELTAKSWCFYPADAEADKTKREKVDYPGAVEKGWAFATGNRIIDYEQVYKFLTSLADTYGVNVKGFGFDKWNAIATVSKLDEDGFDTFEIDQSVKELYGPTKWLKEMILEQKFHYEKNDLLKENFLNAKEIVNTNLSYMLNKKKSTWKIDMVAALVNTCDLWHGELIDDAYDYDDVVIL